MKVWRPYWWAFPALLISVSAYMVWCVAWLKSSDATNRWAWADVALVSSIPIAALSVRAKFVGDFRDVSREPYSILEGIFIAIFFLASLWIWSSRGRLVQRVLPMMLSLAALATVLAFIFAEKISVASSILLPNFLLALASIVASLGLNLAGCKLRQQKPDSQSPTARTSLQEMFVLVAAAAVMLAPMRSMLPDLSNILPVLAQWIYLPMIVIVPAAAWMSAASTNRYVNGLGRWLTIFLIAFMQLYVYYHFIEGKWLYRTYSQFDTGFLLVPSAFVTAFVLNSAFCERPERISH